MSKKYNIAMAGVFCGFLGAVLGLSIILPDKSFSELENRNLSTVPELSVESLTSGDFMEDAEEYTADHIVGRDFWVALKAYCERFSGKQENNGAYFAKNGAVINRVEEPDMEKLQSNVGFINKLVENVDVPVRFGVIPSAATIWNEYLPQGAPTADEEQILSDLFCYDYQGEDPINLGWALSQHKDEYIFYKTDHHWTSLGAFYGANAIFEAMGLEPLNLEDYTPATVTEDFNGTTFSSSGVRWLRPDSIQTYIPEDGVKVTAYYTGKPEESTLYHEEFLEKKDKYSYFLGGNQPLCVIESEKNDGPKVLVIRDSYSDSLAPFLTERFSEVHLFDVRYNMMSPSQYVQANGIDEVIVLYSFNNFVQGQNFFTIGR